jgi:hypothetical protein
MIAVPAGMRVLVATKPIDFRKGADGLVALVRETLGHDPFSGTIFVFRAKRGRQNKDRELGRLGPGAVLEAAGAQCIPMAADRRRHDATDVIAVGCTCRWHGLVAPACARCCATNGNVLRAATD